MPGKVSIVPAPSHAGCTMYSLGTFGVHRRRFGVVVVVVQVVAPLPYVAMHVVETPWVSKLRSNLARRLIFRTGFTFYIPRILAQGMTIFPK